MLRAWASHGKGESGYFSDRAGPASTRLSSPTATALVDKRLTRMREFEADLLTFASETSPEEPSASDSDQLPSPRHAESAYKNIQRTLAGLAFPCPPASSRHGPFRPVTSLTRPRPPQRKSAAATQISRSRRAVARAPAPAAPAARLPSGANSVAACMAGGAPGRAPLRASLACAPPAPSTGATVPRPAPTNATCWPCSAAGRCCSRRCAAAISCHPTSRPGSTACLWR